MAVLAALMSAACSAAGSTDEPEEVTYWVELNLSPEIRVKYTVRRVFLLGPNGEKIGNSLGPFNDRFKVIVPAKYVGTAQRFSVEFSRETSYLDDILKEEEFQTALAILKSFHYSTSPAEQDLVLLPEDRSQVILLPPMPASGPQPVINEGNMSMGYSEQSKDILANIPNIPPMFPVAMNPTTKMQYYFDNSYRAYVGFLTHRNDAVTLKNGQIDPTDYLGFAGGDDWYLVLQNKNAVREGDPARLWLIYTHPSAAPRLYYEDIIIPELFATITVKPDFAGIPIDSALFQALATGVIPISNPETESYTFISKVNNAGALPPPFASLPWPISTSIFNGPFKGEIHGGGFKVTGLNLDATQANNGFVRELTQRTPSQGYALAGVIADLNLEISSVTGSTGTNLGGVAGYVHDAAALIKGVNVTGIPNMLDTKATNVGGIAGKVVGLGSTVTIEDVTQNVATYDIGDPQGNIPIP